MRTGRGSGSCRRAVREAGWLLAPALLLGSSGCFGDPVGVEAPETLQLLIEAGNGQYATPGSTLPDSLVVVVLRADGQELEDPVDVRWSVVEGWGASLGPATAMTDGSQRARAALTLGSGTGLYRVRATLPGRNVDPVEFEARAAEAPTLSGVSPSPVVPGEEATLEGSGFAADLDQNDVLFSGMRAEVLDGSATSLRVRVPPCLNESQVRVQSGLGSLRSDPLTVTVEASAPPVDMVVGDVRSIHDPDAVSCLLLAGGADRAYLAVVHSASPVGGVVRDYSFLLRHPSDGMPAAAEWIAGDDPSPSFGEGSFGPAAVEPIGEAWGTSEDGISQERWDHFLRSRERVLVEEGTGPVPLSRAPSAASVPELGDRKTFSVFDGSGGFTTVEAEVRYVGDHGVVYLDLAAEGSFEPGDLAAFGSEFDDPIHPTVRGAFGSESDLDENGRVVILFTPVVNRLTAVSSGGFVGGFFYGVDLLPQREGSNAGEIFYALVPDPDGVFGQRRSRTQVLSSVPSILTHEFQHMVHFNERVLVRGAEGTDAIWLSEALASTAEELVGHVFSERGDEARAEMYVDGNRDRARSYLPRTDETSLVFNPGSGTLRERGAGWLFLEHVRRRFPGSDGGRWILRGLTRTTRTGVQNVVSVVGRDWMDLVPPWAVALYLDGLDLPVDSRYTFPGLNLRAELTASGASFPLQPPVYGEGDRTRVASLPASTGFYSILEVTDPGGLAVSVAAPDGGALPPEAGIGFSIVRIR